MSDTRHAISTAIRRHPGIHFRELARQLGLTLGQVQYHLRKLEATGSIHADEIYGKTHYYPPGYDAWERRAVALLRRETAGDIVASLLANGPSPPATIASDLDIARSTLSWHLDRLGSAGLVGIRRPDGTRQQLVLERPIETARLLRDADPRLRDRLVGRFTRLVDRLLEAA